MARMADRRMLTTLSTFAVLGFAAVAGCVQDATQADDNGGQIRFDDPEAIRILGIAVNDEIVPLAGMEILLEPTGQVVTTNETGVFAFAVRDPGTYTLTVDEFGYEPTEMELQVPEGGLDGIMMMISPSPIGVPFYESQVYRSFMLCNSPIGGGCFLINTITSTPLIPEDVDDPDFQWEVPHRGLREMRFEAHWEMGIPGERPRANFVARNPGALFLDCNSSDEGFEDTERYYSGPDGGGPNTSPNQFWVRAGRINADVGACHEFTGEKGFQVWQTVRPTWGSPTSDGYLVPMAVSTDVWLTFFHYALAEDREFTALPPEAFDG